MLSKEEVEAKIKDVTENHLNPLNEKAKEEEANGGVTFDTAMSITFNDAVVKTLKYLINGD